MRWTDQGTWIDEDGEHTDPFTGEVAAAGDEFVFNPADTDSEPAATEEPGDCKARKKLEEQEDRVEQDVLFSDGSQDETGAGKDDDAGFLMKDGELV